ncbi:MAG: hypothetical protein C0467_25620 [Planctomycetaceae bacterium]|nr:hypothetical protein [Planctomycetaceae bacterium]
MTYARLLQALVMSPFDLLSQLIGNRFTPIDLVVTPNLIALGLVPSTGTALCPLCGHASDRIHG